MEWLSLCLFVGHDCEPCRNSPTDRDAVGAASCEPKQLCIRRGVTLAPPGNMMDWSMRLQLCSLLLPLVVLERAIKQVCVCVCVSFPICTYCLQPAIADGVTLLLSSADRRHWSQLCRDVDERLWRISPSSWPGVDIHVQPHTIIEPSSRSVLFRSQGNFIGFSLTQLFCGLCVCLLFRGCCSRCRFQPYDCIVIHFVEQIQATFKFC